MGKKAIIRSLITSISLVSYHKILYKKGEKLEAKKHLEYEIRDYSTEGFEKAQRYKFNGNELKEIKEKSIKKVTNILKNKYPGIIVSKKYIKENIIDTMQEFLL